MTQDRVRGQNLVLYESSGGGGVHMPLLDQYVQPLGLRMAEPLDEL